LRIACAVLSNARSDRYALPAPIASGVSSLALAAALHDAETWPERAGALAAQRRAHEEALAWEAHLRPAGAQRSVLHRDWRARHVAAQDGRCHYCDTPFDDERHRPTIDHVVPIARGGPDVFENTVAACIVCNAAKRDLDPREFRAALQMHRRGVVTPLSVALADAGGATATGAVAHG
jgi:5-methylcytosine-specific restriction endonuclease McrA